MTASSVSSLAARGVALRDELFGAACFYMGHAFTGSPSAERDARTLRDGGFTLEYDRTLRLAKSALPVAPVPEKAVVISGKKYRIQNVTDIAASSEWLLGLVQIA